MLVQDIMTERVFTLHPERKVMIADDIMDWAKVRHIPVIDSDDRVVGVVSRADLLRVSLPRIGRGGDDLEATRHLAALEVRDIMSSPVCIDPKATVQAAARLMRKGKHNCLPVTDSHDRLLGIVTSHDMLGLLERADPSDPWLEMEPARAQR